MRRIIGFPKSIAATMAALCFIVWCAPAGALSIREEQKLAEEFIRVVKRSFDIIDDPLLVAYVGQVGRRLLDGMPPQPFEYHFHVIKEDVYNAFAMPAGYIFINSGLLLAMDSEAELAGILAHEIAHVVSRHISQRIARSKKIDLATMAGVVAAIFLGAAGGGASAAQALAIGSAAAGQTMQLAYSRADEAEADHLGLQYLANAGYSAEGLLSIMKKIRSRQWFGSDHVPTYMMTHPAVEERLAQIEAWIAQQPASDMGQPAPRQEARLRQAQYRLRALYHDPRNATAFFQSALARNPNDRELQHAYGLLLARTGSRVEAVGYLQQALVQATMDPVVLGDLGRIYFLEGRLTDALNILRGAVSQPNANPESLFYLGRIHTAMGDYAAAINAFEAFMKRHADYAPAFYFMGEAYGKWGRQAEAHYYLGLHHFSRGEDRTAHFHLTRAQETLQDAGKLETIKSKLEIIGKLPREPQ